MSGRHVHMNGRIYDAKLGRFLQADPIVQAPKNSQSLNRYSYVLNNPLSYTDPTGYFSLRRVLGGLLGGFIAKTPILNTLASILSCSLGGPWGCASWAAFSTYVNGGSLGDAIKAGAIAGATAKAFKQIGGADLSDPGRVFAHAAVGGINAELNGGKFGHGFLSAGLTKSFSLKYGDEIAGIDNDFAETVVVATVGGTISALSGGKFSNGAQSAAMGYLFNQLQSRTKVSKPSNFFEFAKSQNPKFFANLMNQSPFEFELFKQLATNLTIDESNIKRFMSDPRISELYWRRIGKSIVTLAHSHAVDAALRLPKSIAITPTQQFLNIFRIPNLAENTFQLLGANAVSNAGQPLYIDQLGFLDVFDRLYSYDPRVEHLLGN